MSPVAVITGSDSGIGRQTATVLAENGFDIGITYRSDEEGARGTLEEVEGAGRRGEIRRQDLTQLPDAAGVVDELAEALGGLDVLVNNAGTGDPTPSFLDLGYDEWLQVVDTDLNGAFLCSQRAARRMIEGGSGGRIVNITSVHEHVPRVGAAAYCSAKAGLGLLTKVMAMELAEHGITVNAVAPGLIATPMPGVSPDEGYQNIPLGRPGHTREIAETVAFLASEKSSYTTGSSVVVDGGLMLMSAQLGTSA